MKITKLLGLATLCWLGFIGTVFAQRNFYVSESGNDANNGTSQATPWKTIAKVNSSKGTFQAGDVINFNRGDVFYGNLDFTRKNGTPSEPIVLKSYGSGNIAAIRATRVITGWTRENGNIWKTSLGAINSERIPSLFINNNSQQIGREPNASLSNGGYRVINSHAANNTSISEASALPYAANRFRDGEITLRTTDDNVKIETVTSHSGNTVNFSLSRPSDNFENLIEDNFGYFFQNHINTLDVNGEWAHNTNNSTLYLYSTSNPNNGNIEIPNGENAISLNNSKNIRVENLRFEGGLSTTLSLSGTENITLDGCYLYNGNDYLSLGYNMKNIKFQNGVLNQSNNAGLRWELFNGVTFTNNKVMNIGMRPGMGFRSFIGYTGIRFVSGQGSARNFVNGNVLDKIGYHALNFSGGNFEIKNNNIQQYCLTKDDGGGIYTVGNKETNNKIFKNIVHDTPGALLGSPPNRGVKTAGIYLDNDTRGHEVYENAVYNVRGWGLMANLSGNNIYRDNTVYNCSFGIVSSTYNNSFATGGQAALANNNTVLRNIFFNKTPDQFCGRYTNQITADNFNNHLGNFNNNYYIQPFNGGKEVSLRVGRNESELTLSEFRAAYSNYEENSKSSPKKFDRSVNTNDVIKFEVNITNAPKAVSLGNDNYIDAKNQTFTGSATLAPYSILVLLKGDETITPDPTPTPPIPDPTPITTPPTTRNDCNETTTVSVNQDAYLQNTTNFNTTELRVENGRREAYLKFVIPAISGTIDSAKLQLTVGSDGGNGTVQIIRATSNNWNETNLSSANKPSGDTVIGSLNTNYTSNSLHEWTLSGITAGQTISLIVRQQDGNDISFVSKEGNNKPQLILNVDCTPATATPIAPITPVTTNNSNQLILNGTYFLGSTTTNQRIRSIENLNNHDAYMAAPSDVNNQKWTFNHLGDNIYTIQNLQTNRYLEVPFSKCENSIQVSTYTQLLDDHQRWKIVTNGTGTFGIQPAHCTEQGLDRNFGRVDTNVITYSYSKNNNNQKWEITPVNNNSTALFNVDLTTTKDLTVFPNPASSAITIEGLSDNSLVEISNLVGQVLISKSISIDNNIIIVSELQSGLYVVSITNAETNEKLISKLIIK